MSDITVNPYFYPLTFNKDRYLVLYGGAGCFDFDTLIKTPNGFKKIGEINIGEFALSFNKTKKIPEYKEIINKFSYKSDEIRQNIIIFVFNNITIKCTYGHKFYFNEQWITAYELAQRSLEASGYWQRNILHQQYGKVTYNKSLWEQENSDNETVFRWQRLFKNCNNQEKSNQIFYYKNTSFSCYGFFGKLKQLFRSKSQKWDKDRQPDRKFRVGYSFRKLFTRIQDWFRIKCRFKTSTTQTNRRICKGNKENYKTINRRKEKISFRKVFCINRHNKGFDLQTEPKLAARQINFNKIKEIRFSREQQIVYDIEVKDNHNYCITEDNIIVHNSGKSHFAAQKILFRCLNEKNHRILIIRKVAKTINESVFKQLHTLISDYGLTSIVTENKTNMSFHFNNGNEIITTGLDDPEKIKSIFNITSIWIEEATELDKSDFDQLDLRLRNDTENYKQIILTFNPVAETHWIKAELFDKAVDSCTLVHSTYINNRFLDAEYITTLKNRVASDENLKRVYVDGLWGRVRTGYEYYTTFKYNTHVKKCTYNNKLTVHLSFDQNVNPYLSALLAQIEKIENIYYVRFLKEYALRNPQNKTDVLARKIIEDLSEYSGTLYLYGDSSGNKEDTRNTYTDYDIIKRILSKHISNESDRILRKNPLHKKRRPFMGSLFFGQLPIIIEIDPSCKYLIADLESVKEDADGAKLKEHSKDKLSGITSEKYGHHSDCFDYLIIKAFQSYFDNYSSMIK